jgi:ADP-heptose:LPS heptosyltransferase
VGQAAGPLGPDPDGPAAQNILVIRLKSMGDVLLTLPAVYGLRAALPQARITFLVSKEYVPLLEGFPGLAEVIAFDRDRYRRLQLRPVLAETLSVLRRLRRGKFSLAIDLQGFGETALLSWCSRAPQRWGAVKRPSRGWAYTRSARPNPTLHPAERHVAFLQQCGLAPTPIRNQLVLPAAAREGMHRFYAERRLAPACPTLFIQAFTSSPEKRWPLAGYLGIAKYWRGRGFQVIFGGAPGEQTALEPARLAGFPVAAGAPLMVTMGLLEHSTLVLGGDTGLLHLAVALGRRVVMLIGSTRPGTAYPFGHRDWAIRPRTGFLISGVASAAVQAACTRALNEQGFAGKVRPG